MCAVKAPLFSTSARRRQILASVLLLSVVTSFMAFAQEEVADTASQATTSEDAPRVCYPSLESPAFRSVFEIDVALRNTAVPDSSNAAPCINSACWNMCKALHQECHCYDTLGSCFEAFIDCLAGYECCGENCLGACSPLFWGEPDQRLCMSCTPCADTHNGQYCRQPFGWLSVGDPAVDCEGPSNWCTWVECSNTRYYCTNSGLWVSGSSCDPETGEVN